MRVDLLTREFPPDVYGGAGVHVEYLARELAQLVDLRIHCWGGARADERVRAYSAWEELDGDAALEAMSIDLAMTAGVAGTELIHTHTWYTNLAGHLGKLAYHVPHVVTAHSLEPLRPWKREQLGGGYALSSFCERIAIEAADCVIAVSSAMRDDVLAFYPTLDPGRVEVVLNGIDADEYRPDPATDVLERYGIDPARPSVVFVGRVTRQKGLTHLVAAAHEFLPAAQLVLCAGSPDTPEIAAELATRVESLRDAGRDVVVIEAMIPKPEVIQLLSHASVFACPSVYEPLGIVNLEAMACEAPVVASAVGGIPEVVEDGVTGLLVPYDPGAGDDRFAADLAEGVNALLGDPARARALGRAGRERAIERFSWSAIAEQTRAVYERLLG